jgi:calpain-15
VKDIFLQDFTNKAGVYAIQLFICGERKTVVVDDRFPWDPTKNNWAFSRTSTGCEIWVLLLEKAWAKVYGNYQRIEGGTCDEALHPLTGCPTKNFIHSDFKDKDKLWSILLLSDQSNFPMCTAVSSQMEDEVSTGDVKKAGLVDGHAYSLIGAKEIKDKAGKTVRLCLVRNPWGKKEWSGDWSDGSSLWDDVTKP